MSWTSLGAKVVLLSQEWSCLKKFSAGQTQQNEDTFCCQFFGYCRAPWLGAFYYYCTDWHWRLQIFWTSSWDGSCSSPWMSSLWATFPGQPSMTCWAIYWQWRGSLLSWVPCSHISHSSHCPVRGGRGTAWRDPAHCPGMALCWTPCWKYRLGSGCRHNPQIQDLASWCLISTPRVWSWYRPVRRQTAGRQAGSRCQLSPILKCGNINIIRK